VVRDARARGWHVTLITNLMAGDPDALAATGVDRVLAGIHGATPETWAAFHPGWEEEGFHDLCRRLRVLGRAGVETRHVHVIAAPNAGEIAGMVRFGAVFQADRVNLKLASLGRGTEAIALSREALEDLGERAIPEARALAAHLGVRTTLDTFARQVDAALEAPGTTTPMAREPCRMGQVYARVTADREVLFCCDPEVRVGALAPGTSFGDLWSGPAWRALRERVAAGERFPGCATCGKFEQNLAWNEAIG